jgi:ribulose-5-phosphate 4-epimerase/fuculose-1-phosphate aldolase
LKIFHASLRRAIWTWVPLLTSAVASAQPVGAPPALIDDLVAANHVLAREKVVDGYGHVSVRSPINPQRFYLSRSLAPALVTANDIMEFDLEGNAIDGRGRLAYQERFIHSEIYKSSPSVNAVVHSHSPAVIPFGVTNLPLRAVQHTAAFLGAEGVPVFDIAKKFGDTNLFVDNIEKGKELALVLGASAVGLMRGHGNVVVGRDIPAVVARSIYTEWNARTLLVTIPLGASIVPLSPGEVQAHAREKARSSENREWHLWKAEAAKSR